MSEAPPSTDSLIQHCRTTKAFDWHRESARLGRFRPHEGGRQRLTLLHQKYVDAFDRPRCDERAKRMIGAIHLVDRLAVVISAITWQELTEVQSIVLGDEHVRFRDGVAFSKGGLEVYGYHPDLQRAFSQKIKQDGQEELHPLVKSIRLYLDVCFFHPFQDGNARAARLALQLILQRDNVFLKSLGPLFRIPLAAGSQEGYLAFLNLAKSLHCDSPAHP